jgi:putative nucleotidyltransferase with HDIG domain
MKNEQLLNVLYRLMKKDATTFEHSIRVGRIAKIVSLLLHYNKKQTSTLVTGCLLHDIGKILIPNEILNKEASLTIEEWETMRRHPFLGVNLAVKEGILNQSIIETIHFHHERWDGSGYPYGLRGNDIPSSARICAIIDAFDSMLHDRPYRKGISIQEAKEELWYQSRKQFDKNYVQVLLKIPISHLDFFSTSIA